MNTLTLGEGRKDDFEDVTKVDFDEMKMAYHNWLSSYLQPETVYDSFVLGLLFEIPFRCDSMPADANRLSDVYDLRMQFVDSAGIVCNEYLDSPVSVLEVITVLAMKMAYLRDGDEVSDDNAVALFYHEMLSNLGIDEDFMENDWKRKERLIRRVVKKLLDRRYSKDGSGGLFPLKSARTDQRNVELWYQMNAYMIENH